MSDMSDRDFLIWIHCRLEHVHGENPENDYMHKLRAVIEGTDNKQRSPNVASLNNPQQNLRAMEG